tara:strand:+ start:159 stop:428 length:270 start_codon:yes stop_codon:yes gene_type:complete
MSNEANERLQEFISETVGEIWQLPTRPDLEKDCVDYVWEHWDKEDSYQDRIYVNFLVIQFLSYHCREAVSSQDIEYMAIAEKERLLTMT